MDQPRRNSALCPNCRRLISLDEDVCPYCGLRQPGARWKHSGIFRALANGESLVQVLIGVNVGVFILSLILGFVLGRGGGYGFLGALSPSSISLLLLGASGTEPIDAYGRWWSLLSANYLHGGIFHILFNMMAISQVAPLVIREYGPYRMFAIYTYGGAFGYLVSYWAGIPFTVGASSALCALLGAAVYYGKSRGGTYGDAIYRTIGGWIIANFIFGFLMPAINNWAHGGGIAGGIILGLVLGYREKKADTFTHQLLAGLALVLSAGAVGWGILSTILAFTRGG